MLKHQISLASLLLLMGTAPIWLMVIYAVVMSPGYGAGPKRFVIGPVVLGGVTWAIHWLLRKWRDAWAISAMVAAIICVGTLMVVAWVEHSR